MKVALQEITVDPTVHIRQKLDAETIERYMEVLDELPPVVLYKLDGELIMADGFHREAAAERLGRSKVEAEIRQGTRDEALEYAVRANVSHGKALSSEEYREAVRRLRRLHPNWGYGQIAKMLNRSESFVRGVIDVDEVRRGVLRSTPLPDSHLQEIARAPRETWEPLVKAAETKGWTRDETREVVRTVKDESVPSERKEELLEGKAEPIVSKAGEPAYLRETVGRRMAEAVAKDKIVALTGAWAALSNLEQLNPKDVIDSLDTFHLERVVKDTPRDINYLTQLVNLARQRLELWKAVDK